MKNGLHPPSTALKNDRNLRKKLFKHKSKALDRLASEVHAQVFEQIDCLDCARCCQGIPALLTATDVRRISTKIGCSSAQFYDLYLQQDEDNDWVFEQTPCVFLLEENQCSIYEFRPKACRSYPHTDQQFSKNIAYHLENSQYCPASFHILAEIKDRLP
jgi:hypothetical protein